MKKSAIVCILAILLIITLFIGCKKSDGGQTVTPNEDAYVVVSFYSLEIDCTIPEPITVKAGVTVEALPYPEDAKNLSQGHSLAWYVDEDLTTLYGGEALLEDTTLYLGSKPNVYSVTFVYDKSMDFEGEFPTSYVFGERTLLPTHNDGKGYYEGRWYYGEGEDDYYSIAIPDTCYGDLTLTYVANPVQYSVFYMLSGVEAENPNPTIYDITMGDVTLLPAVADGYEFDYWKYGTTSGNDELAGSKIDALTFDLVYGHYFTLIAVWKK